MRGYVDCVGCEQRRLDAQRVVDFFNANEVEIVNRPQDCDVAVLVTCGVDSFSERKSLNRIADIDRERLPSSRLLIGGCLPAICPEKLKEFNVHGMFSPRDFQLFDHVLETPRKAQSISDYASPNTSVFDYIEDVLSTEDADLTRRRDYDRAKNGFRIVIDEGCLLNCAYCVIRYATGRLKSRPIEVIIEEFRHGLDLHQPTLMLMGGDTGAYGWDTGAHLHDLLRKLLAFDGDYHIYIHDFNINWAIKELDAYCAVFEQAHAQKKIGVVNFPIQSGSDKVLRLMHRPYSSSEIIHSLRAIKTHAPSMGIGTHIIVGFPGERDAEFEQTVKMLADFDFDFVTCFSYSENQRASSYSYPEKINPAIIRQRMISLQELFGAKVRLIGVQGG